MKRLISFLLFVLLSFSAAADEINPALLEITETDSQRVDVVWKIPVKQDRGLGLTPILPEYLEPLGPASGRRAGVSGYVEYSSWQTGGRSLSGETIVIDGLGRIQTDVLVRVSLADGTQHNTILRPGKKSYTIPAVASRGEVAWSYWVMGTIHILEGVDHLLFLLVLLLIINGLWPLIKTVTAFTVAHSLTLALATLEVITIPSAPTEAVISLSIVLLAVEAVRKFQGELTLAERFPWLIAFTFGLVHGLGFAGALAEIGVPPTEVPVALLMFNVGVETGQVMFVIAVTLLLAGLRYLYQQSAQVFYRLTPYAIGSIAAFWTIQRIDSFI
ncbi:MAG: HupE/UreJ family protein [Gammaproteobacteria bacterium]